MIFFPKVATQAVHSSNNCKLPSGEALSQTLQPCVAKYLDQSNADDVPLNYLCK